MAHTAVVHESSANTSFNHTTSMRDGAWVQGETAAPQGHGAGRTEGTSDEHGQQLLTHPLVLEMTGSEDQMLS